MTATLRILNLNGKATLNLDNGQASIYAEYYIGKDEELHILPATLCINESEPNCAMTQEEMDEAMAEAGDRADRCTMHRIEAEAQQEW